MLQILSYIAQGSILRDVFIVGGASVRPVPLTAHVPGWWQRQTSPDMIHNVTLSTPNTRLARRLVVGPDASDLQWDGNRLGGQIETTGTRRGRGRWRLVKWPPMMKAGKIPTLDWAIGGRQRIDDCLSRSLWMPLRSFSSVG